MLGETHSLGSEPVNIRRFNLVLPVGPHLANGQIVGEDEDHVARWRRGVVGMNEGGHCGHGTGDWGNLFDVFHVWLLTRYFENPLKWLKSILLHASTN